MYIFGILSPTWPELKHPVVVWWDGMCGSLSPYSVRSVVLVGKEGKKEGRKEGRRRHSVGKRQDVGTVGRSTPFPSFSFLVPVVPPELRLMNYAMLIPQKKSFVSFSAGCWRSEHVLLALTFGLELENCWCLLIKV